jgi:hypothetical protein
VTGRRFPPPWSVAIINRLNHAPRGGDIDEAVIALRLVLQLTGAVFAAMRRRRIGGAMRGPISEAIIIVALGFFIGGIAGAIIHFTFDSSNAIVPHPASGRALGGAPDYPKQ